MLRQPAGDARIDGAREHRLHDLDVLGLGHPHAVHEDRLPAGGLQSLGDLGPAPVHDDDLGLRVLADGPGEILEPVLAVEGATTDFY